MEKKLYISQEVGNIFTNFLKFIIKEHKHNMIINAEIIKNTEEIGFAIIVLKHKLIKKKDIIINIEPIDLEIINKGITILDNIKHNFESVADLDSIEMLKHAELFFSQNAVLRDFIFPEYQSKIPLSLKILADIEIQLEVLSKKADDLQLRGFRSASLIAKGVVSDLKNLNQWRFKEKIIGYNDYKSRALAIISEAKPILEQHRGYKKLLGNLILLLLTLGCAFIINKAVNNHFLFFRQTKSSEQLGKLDQIVSQLII